MVSCLQLNLTPGDKAGVVMRLLKILRVIWFFSVKKRLLFFYLFVLNKTPQSLSSSLIPPDLKLCSILDLPHKVSLQEKEEMFILVTINVDFHFQCCFSSWTGPLSQTGDSWVASEPSCEICRGFTQPLLWKPWQDFARDLGLGWR